MGKAEKEVQKEYTTVLPRGIEEYGREEKRQMRHQIFEIFKKYDLSIAESKQLLNDTLQAIDKFRAWKFIKE